MFRGGIRGSVNVKKSLRVVHDEKTDFGRTNRRNRSEGIHFHRFSLAWVGVGVRVRSRPEGDGGAHNVRSIIAVSESVILIGNNTDPGVKNLSDNAGRVGFERKGRGGQ